MVFADIATRPTFSLSVTVLRSPVIRTFRSDTIISLSFTAYPRAAESILEITSAPKLLW